MAKKRKVEAADIERAIQNILPTIPGVRDLPEFAYCDLVLEALEGIKTGLEMRRSELDDEGDNEDA